jgi:hypothetical protein
MKKKDKGAEILKAILDLLDEYASLHNENFGEVAGVLGYCIAIQMHKTGVNFRKQRSKILASINELITVAYENLEKKYFTASDKGKEE